MAVWCGCAFSANHLINGLAASSKLPVAQDSPQSSPLLCKLFSILFFLIESSNLKKLVVRFVER
ncbi:TPA: hypothetical protein ACF54C_000001, partial [Serratia marcescens]